MQPTQIVGGAVIALAAALAAAGPVVAQNPAALPEGFLAPHRPPRAHYEIRCSIDLSKSSFEGTETITFTNTGRAPLRRLALEWPMLAAGGRMSGIRSGGRPVQVVARLRPEAVSGRNHCLLIQLPKPIAPKQKAEVRVHFELSGSPITSDKMVIKLTGWHPRLWWGFETHDDYDVEVRSSSGFAVATSGLLDAKTGRYRGKSIRSFGVVLYKGHHLIKKSAGDVAVRCIFSDRQRKCARLVLDTATDVIGFYREHFGFYPYRCLLIVPGMNRPVGGYPVATNIVAIHGMAQMEKKPRVHWQWITAHEIGHQYWGEYVLDADPSRWLSIGLGIYADRKYTGARRLGAQKHRAIVARYVQGVRDRLDTTADVSAEKMRSAGFDFNNVVTHGKGYSIVSALACVLGEPALDRICLRCLKEFAGRRLGSRSFQRVCEEETGQDLGWFFDQWARSNRYLSYAVESHQSRKDGEGYLSEVRVKCVGSLKMPVPTAVDFEDGTRRVAFTDRLLDVTVLRFQSQAKIKRVQLDPNRELAIVLAPIGEARGDIRTAVTDLPWTGAGKKSLDIYKTALRQQAQVDGSTWGKLAMTLYDGKFYPEALEAFRRASRMAPEKSSWHFGSFVWQGHVLDILDRRDEALISYRKALKVYAGGWLRHDQYRMRLDRKWVETRLKTPFRRR